MARRLACRFYYRFCDTNKYPHTLFAFAPRRAPILLAGARAGDMDHPLIAATKRGDVAEVIRARDACGDLGAVRSPNTENTALHIAAATGHVGVLEALLPDTKRTARDVSGASAWHVDAWNKNRDTPLMHALARARVDAAAALLDAGARLDAVNEARSTPLHLAASSGARACVDLVLSRRMKKKSAGVAVDQPDRLGRTALHYAACASVGCVAALLGAGANPFARENKGLEPAAVAERESHPETAAALRAAMRNAERAAAAAAAALAEEDLETAKHSSGKPAEKRNAKKKKGKASSSVSGAVVDARENTQDVALEVAPGWEAAFMARADSTHEGEYTIGEESRARTEPEPAKSPPVSPSRSATCGRLSQTQAPDQKPETRVDIEAPAPAVPAPARSWAAVATRSAAAPAPARGVGTVAAPGALSAPAAAPSSNAAPDDQPPFSAERSWESDARARLEQRHPTAAALKVSLRNLLGLGVDEMSASQLEAAEEVHRELLVGLTDARVELARRQERARLEEAAAIERTIETLAAAGTR